MHLFDQDELIREISYIPNALSHQFGTIVASHSSRPLQTTTNHIIRKLREGWSNESPYDFENSFLRDGLEVFCDDDERLNDLLKEASDLPSTYGDMREIGVDAFAWYVSFHHSKDWGIYIPLTGLLKFSSNFVEVTPNPVTAVNIGLDLLLSHEGVHYGIDIAVSQLELIEQRAIYIPERNLLRNNAGYIEREEKIANAAKLILSNRLAKNRTLGCPDLLATCRNLVRSQPAGYRDGLSCESKSKFHSEANQYLHQVLNSSTSYPTNIRPSTVDLSLLIPLQIRWGKIDLGYVDISRCPIYIIEDLPTSVENKISLYFIGALLSIEESSNFLKDLSRRADFAKMWDKTKQLLSNPITKKHGPNLDLKIWDKKSQKDGNPSKEWWSVRVGGASSNVRAHLYRFGTNSEWVADQIGDANKMGHHKVRR